MVVEHMTGLKDNPTVLLDPSMLTSTSQQTVALVFVKGPIYRKRRRGTWRRTTHYRIVRDNEDLNDGSISSLPSWAEAATIRVLLQKITDAQLNEDEHRRRNFLNALNELHNACLQIGRRTGHPKSVATPTTESVAA